MWKLGGTQLLMVVSGAVICAVIGGTDDGRPWAYGIYAVCGLIFGYLALVAVNRFERARRSKAAPAER